jgi:hypothetical protein
MGCLCISLTFGLVPTYEQLAKDFIMTSREWLLGLARLHQQRGEPIPVDMLAEADRLGLSLTLFDQPNNAQLHQGEFDNGTNKEETDF